MEWTEQLVSKKNAKGKLCKHVKLVYQTWVRRHYITMSLERSMGKGFWRILVFFNTRCLVVFSGALLLYEVKQPPL